MTPQADCPSRAQRRPFDSQPAKGSGANGKHHAEPQTRRADS